MRSLRGDGLGGWTSDPGLDLTEGSHLLLTLDFQAFVAERLDDLADAPHVAIRTADQDRGDRIGHQDLRTSARGISLSLHDPARAEVMHRIIDQVVADNSLADLPGRWFGRPADIGVSRDGARFTLTLSDPLLAAWRQQVIARSIAVIRRRIDERGFPEPSIRRQGQDRILVQVPGLDDPQRLTALIGTRAKLTFQMVRDVHPGSQRPSPAGSRLENLPSAERTRTGDPETYYTVQRHAPISGDCLVDARREAYLRDRSPIITIRFDSHCTGTFADLTRQNVNRRLAMVLDGEVLMAPVIRSPILGGMIQISHLYATEDLAELALFLRAGALPAPLIFTEARFVGPAPGQDAIDSGEAAAGPGVGWLIGLLLLLIVVIACFLLIQSQQKTNQGIQGDDS